MPDAGLYLTDGAVDFSGGVDSGKTALIQSAVNPNGLRRDQLAWLINGTVRGGTISPRSGWKFLTTVDDGGLGIYQGGYLYEPREASPFLVLSVGGHILRLETDAGAVPVDLSVLHGILNPPEIDKAYFQQAEEFLIIQAGDYGLVDPPTLPIFYNSHALFRRSNGVDPLNPGPNNEIPAALQMDYYMQRLWYSQIRITTAGDIVGGAAGTLFYGFRDAVLKVTENPMAIGGDGFAVPTHAGSIRALAHSAAIDTALGQGQLFIFTRKDIYSLNVPVTRADWLLANKDNQPLQRVVQLKWGTSGDRSVIGVNGDLYYQTMEPGIRSLALAVRFFQQWANIPISRNVNRVLDFNDRSLTRFGTGMLFDNRLWESCLPFAVPLGTVHRGATVLDFDIIGSFQDRLAAAPVPAWEGMVEGLDILQLFSGDYGGRERAFAVVISKARGGIELWEITSQERFENGDNRIRWSFETPSFDCRDAFMLKELQAVDLWVDSISSEVHFLIEYRVDDDPCFHWYSEFDRCFARTSCEDVVNPVCYPVTDYQTGNAKPLTLAHPPPKECMSNGSRPAYIGHAFQFRITITGYCRFRGLLMYCSKVQRSLYGKGVC